MVSGVKTGRSAVIPALRYRDALVAIDWLCRNFGFEKHLVVVGDDGRTVHHAQLVLGGGMVMLGSVDNTDSAYGRQIRQPDEVGGFETQSPYIVVADADAVYRSVKADGGQVVIEIKDEDYGGRGFTCRDPEGRLWSVGTYDPWAEPSR
ncbi:MAG: VOC family protein [Ramlibacter sp.]|nr:VOC family protein [Ramlibacter sp.]